LSVPGATVDFPDRKVPPISPTTTSHFRPDVPLPAGATAEDDAWALWDNESRIFRCADRVVLNGAFEVIAEVRTCGVQYLDGSVDNAEDPPTIDICMTLGLHEGLSSDAARKLAAVLLEAAAEAEQWVSE
jgi:hypothetical protein